MRIDKTTTRETLSSENAALESQIAECARQEQTMANVSIEDAALFGMSYEVLEARIHKRPLLIQMHSFAYEAIKAANSRNIDLLSGLPDSTTPGVLSTEECDEEISKLNDARDRLQAAWSVQLYKAQSGGSSDANSNIFSWTNTINNINATYSGLVSTNETLIRHWEEVKQAAYDYDKASAGLYTDAKDYIDQVLSKSSEAIYGCIATGGYGGSAYDALLSNYADYRVKIAKPYLNDDELAALKAALLDDGLITKEDIYDGTLNENLYSALTKLPDNLVKQGDVEAVADAYNTMWNEYDTAAIERLIELSYVIEDIWVSGDYPFTGTPEEAKYLPVGSLFFFRQSSLIGRVSESVQNKFLMVDKDDESNNYQRLLAGANMLNLLDKDNRLLLNDRMGMDVELGIMEAKTGGAVVCNLLFNQHIDPTINIDVEKIKYMDTEIAGAFDLITFTGDLNVICTLMESQKKEENLIDDFDYFGFFGKEALSTGLGAIPGGIGTVLSTVFSFGTELLEHQQQLERNAAIRDPQFVEIAAFAENPLLKDLGFAFNLKTDRGTSADFSTNAEMDIYASNNVQASISEAIKAFYPEPNSTYDARQLFSDLKYNTHRSVVPDIESLTTPSFLGPNRTQAFVYWCNESPTLQDNLGADIGRIEEIHNYDYIKNREFFNARGVWVNYEK